ncbi:MAG: FMN-binding protein [Clostridia bacterium]|nr:FMN-binding protein [Clostridia bacterium]
MQREKAAWLVLALIAMGAGLLLGFTNAVTADVIAQRALDAAEQARREVFPAAQAFVELPPCDAVQDSFCAMQGEQCIGYVCTLSVQGYGGPIEVVVGLDAAGALTGISVGGSRFAETAGLGANTRSPAFTGQFAGLVPPLTVKKDVDAVTGATISSTAVVNAVNAAAAYVAGLDQ